MARFFTIASGSSGNCAYVGGADGGVLVDAGVCCKSILSGLAEHDVPLEQVRGIFITHEHIDHIRGLRVLLKRCDATVYASAQVLDYLIGGDHLPPGALLEVVDSQPVVVSGMEAKAFATSHDSVHSQGYRFHTADDRSVGFATDLGFVSDTVASALHGCDLVVLESNYEHTMLMNGPYPYVLKKRIAGRHGHLSNDACAALAPILVESGTARLVLAHLSKENNLPELAEQATERALTGKGMRRGQDYLLSVAPRSQAGERIRF